MKQTFEHPLIPGHYGWEFYFYCLFHHPALILVAFRQGIELLLFLLRGGNETQLEQIFSRYLTYIPNRENLLAGFWNHPRRASTLQAMGQLQSGQIIKADYPRWLAEAAGLPDGVTWNFRPSSVLPKWLTPELTRFLLVGCINGLSGWLLENFWSVILHPNIGFIVGYLMSLALSYLLNSHITFQEPLSLRRMARFYVSYIPNFLIQEVSVLLLYNILNLPHFLAFLLAALIGTPVTFLLLKYFAFEKRRVTS